MYAETPVIVQLKHVKLPAFCVTPAAVTLGSGGMAKGVGEPHPVTSAHGSAVAHVRSYDVM